MKKNSIRIHMMNRLFVIAIACLLMTLPGCRWSGMGLETYSPFKPKPEPVFAAGASEVDIVDGLNATSTRLRSWQSENTVIKVKGPGQPMAVSLSAVIAVEAPRNFRLRAQSTLAQADMGSNNNKLWFWVQPGADNVITAKHTDLPMVQQHANLPFDPEWLMEVLGVVPLDRERVELHTADDPRSRFTSLVFNREGRDGKSYKRLLTVDNQIGAITEHRLLDSNNESLAIAELTNHQVIDGLMMPHRIRLHWPITKTTFEMRIKEIEVNCPIAEDRWSVPEMDRYPAIDLGEQIAARYGYDRRSEVPDVPEFSGRQSLEDVRQQLRRPQQTAEQPLDAPSWDDEF